MLVVEKVNELFCLSDQKAKKIIAVAKNAARCNTFKKKISTRLGFAAEDGIPAFFYNGHKPIDLDGIVATSR